jgi:AmmeMemoRadiSam system protein B
VSTNETDNQRPKLRVIQVQPTVARGQPILLLQDPLRLSETAVFVPQAIAPLLAFCDGTRTVDELRASLLVRAGVRLSSSDLAHVIARLDDALLLDNDRSREAKQRACATYRAAPYRYPALAGRSYPDEPAELQALLDSFLAGLSDGRGPADDDYRGLVSPHIDYERGGPVYAEVWRTAAEAARAAEVAVILGTDHNGGAGAITPTRQSYATPYGILPTDVEMVDVLAAALGEEAAFAEELHHRGEHSIELATVWLHHMRGGEPCAVVPILTGSFYGFVSGNQGAPAAHAALNRAIAALRSALAGRQALIVAAGDLAHIGPAFDDAPVDFYRKAQLEVQDRTLIETMCRGDAESFFEIIRAEDDRRNVCGLPPIYLALRLLADARGEPAGYERCPADMNGTSFVSICGVVWR